MRDTEYNSLLFCYCIGFAVLTEVKAFFWSLDNSGTFSEIVSIVVTDIFNIPMDWRTRCGKASLYIQKTFLSKR